MMIRTGLAALILALAGGCNGRSGPATPPVTATPPDGTAPGSSMPASPPTATARVTAQQPGRPPLVRLTVEVVLDNPTDQPRWFAIAQRLPAKPGGVDRSEVFGTGTAVIGALFGTGAIYAARVAPKSKATLQNLAIGWWTESPGDALPGLTVTVADQLTIDGGAATWFGVEPLLPDGAVIDAGGEAGHEHSTGGPEATLALVGAAAQTIALAK